MAGRLPVSRVMQWPAAACLLLVCLPVAGQTETPLTLEDALREAHAANAKLPVSAFDVTIARQKREEARAERWLKVALEGDFIYAPPSGYDPILTNLGEFRSQVVARQPVYDGGARRAAIAASEAEVASAGARYRIAEKDLDLEVRSRFAELLEAANEIEIRREGIERLTSYQTSLQSRRAAGQGVGADILKTGVRLSVEQASLVEAEQRSDEARVALNDLMGRDVRGPLVPAPLPPPEKPTDLEGSAWAGAPELAAAEAETKAAEAQADVARAEGKPHLFLGADVGFWGSDTSRWIPLDIRATDPDANFWDRVRRDAGYSFNLTFSWPLWDFGAIRARVAQADAALRQSRQKLEVERREARRQWESAMLALQNLYRQIEILSRAAPDARDSYLDAESRYRGGAANALEVLDAYSASVEAGVRLAESVSRYRIARAVAQRWGAP
ncbi:MAG TPA: TolC family protein [Thermoanaerobaculia bacterium]